MNWWDRIFAYCERGADPSFWAEPFNAVSNVAFFLVAIAGAVHLIAQPARRWRIAEWALVVLVVLIGIGSFLFHTYATRWASVADTAPIGLFMIGYLAYALRRFVRLHWLGVAVLVGAFLWAMHMAGNIPCTPELLPITAAAGRPCFNGSLGYIPAFLTLLIVGGVLLLQRHAAGVPVFAAGVLFAMSLLLRTIDFEVCALTEILGRSRGTHALWHVLNASVLYLLLRAAIRYGGDVAAACRDPARLRPAPG